MCTNCDGTSPADMITGLEEDIDTCGWALVGVTGREGTYFYTIGLPDHVGHPDMIVLDVSEEVAVPLLTDMVDILDQFNRTARAELARLGLRMVEVHPDHLAGPLFDVWQRYNEYEPHPGDILQVVVPESWYCPLHAMGRRRLDLPGPLVPAIGCDSDDR